MELEPVLEPLELELELVAPPVLENKAPVLEALGPLPVEVALELPELCALDALDPFSCRFVPLMED